MAAESAPPVTMFSRTAARISTAAAALFLLLLAALHLLEPEIDPSWHMISDYELGRYGFVMVLAFFSLAVSSASLFIAIRLQVRTVAGYIGLGCLLESDAEHGLGAGKRTAFRGGRPGLAQHCCIRGLNRCVAAAGRRQVRSTTGHWLAKPAYDGDLLRMARHRGLAHDPTARERSWRSWPPTRQGSQPTRASRQGCRENGEFR